MPIYEPDKWNDTDSGGDVQDGNNCYDYAADRPSDPKPGGSQPGRAGGKPLPEHGPITCDQVMESAEADGFDCGKGSGEPVTKVLTVPMAAGKSPSYYSQREMLNTPTTIIGIARTTMGNGRISQVLGKQPTKITVVTRSLLLKPLTEAFTRRSAVTAVFVLTGSRLHLSTREKGKHSPP